MSFPWNIPVAQNATIPAHREAVNDALQYLREGIDLEPVEKTATAALSADERFVVCPSGTFTLTLPVTTDLPVRPYVIKNLGSGVVTVVAAGFDTIDGGSSYLLSGSGRAAMFIPNGSDWIVAAEAGELPIPSNALVYELDNSDFDGVTTSFPGLLRFQPDLSDGRTVCLYVRGRGLFTLAASSPGPFEFTLSGDTDQDVTFGRALEAGDVAVATHGSRSTAPPRYVYMMGFAGELTPAAVPWAWTFPEGLSGEVEVDCAGSSASALAEAATDAVVRLVHAGSEFGQVLFPGGGGTPVFTAATAVPVSAASQIYPILPSPADATLAGISITLRVRLDG